ncbi:MAG TPA: hypothetical protein VJ984_10420 [Xanthomonadales bacterium]|nr:hypothetical protein [Xanthomonadales bacterium]
MKRQFEEYFESLNAHEIEKALSYISDDFTLHFTEYNFSIDKEGLVDVLGWDKGVNGKFSYEKLTIKEDSITGLFKEQNDFLKLLGIKDLRATNTYRFEFSGKIVEQTYTPLPDQPSFQDRMQECIEWAKANRPLELRDIYPENQMLFNEETGKKWVILLKEWKTRSG